MRQLPLRLRLPPVRKSGELPASLRIARQWVSRAVQSGKWQDARARRVLAAIRQLGIDDVLYFGDWRVEFLWLAGGYPHYRLYYMPKRHYCVGVADIREDTTSYGLQLAGSLQLVMVQRYLAAYLVALGADSAPDLRVIKADARTPLNADTSRQYRLFRVRTKLDKVTV